MEAWQNGISSPLAEETTFKTADNQVERKRFNLRLREIPLGQFVPIPEVGPIRIRPDA